MTTATIHAGERRRFPVIVSSLALGLTAGAGLTAGGFALLDGNGDDVTPSVRSEAVTPAGEVVSASTMPFGSVDAAERWQDADSSARLEACAGTPRSADSLERCLIGPRSDTRG